MKAYSLHIYRYVSWTFNLIVSFSFNVFNFLFFNLSCSRFIIEVIGINMGQSQKSMTELAQVNS